MKRYLLITILIVGLIGGAFAFPFANYGNIRVPDAYVMPHAMGQFTIMNYFHPENNDKDDDMAYNWGTALNVGILNYGELGLVFTGDEVFYAHIKAKVLGETVTTPDITIGVDKLFSEVGSHQLSSDDYIDAGNYRRNTLYLAISKTTLLSGIPGIGDLPTRFTIGAGSHRFQGSVDLSESISGLFGSVQAEAFPNFAVIAEMDGHNFNTAFEYRYQNLSGKLMMYRIEEWGRRDPKLGFSLSYMFDRYVDEDLRGRFSPFRDLGAQMIDTREGVSLDELQRIRRQRERAEEELREIRRLLEE